MTKSSEPYEWTVNWPCVSGGTIKWNLNACLDGFARYQMSALAKEMVLVLSDSYTTIFSAM